MDEQEEIKQYGQLVAKAWSDPAFRDRLLADPAGILRAEGFTVPADMQVRVLEPDGPRLYMPLPAELPDGEEPSERVALWHRAQTEPAFKTRLLAEPAAVLAEAGIELPAGVPVEVVETSDTQGYIAMPPAPEGLDADAVEDVVGYFSCCGQPAPPDPRYSMGIVTAQRATLGAWAGPHAGQEVLVTTPRPNSSLWVTRPYLFK
ncbi:MAG: nitrile hydratase subunit alpha [Dehalococcoidia bacterium]